MAKTVIHLSKVTQRRLHTVTGTLCNRMASGADINCTEATEEVTCKFCLKQISYRR